MEKFLIIKLQKVMKMSNNVVLLFTSFWFSIFFLLLAVMSKIINTESINYFDSFLAVLFCILCSYEWARKLALRLSKYEK